MAHTCPECGSYCTCNGDIEDMCLDTEEAVIGCLCCAEKYDDTDEDAPEWDEQETP
jgi:hypothetical protein